VCITQASRCGLLYWLAQLRLNARESNFFGTLYLEPSGKFMKALSPWEDPPTLECKLVRHSHLDEDGTLEGRANLLNSATIFIVEYVRQNT
jgi:hypothetical protein